MFVAVVLVVAAAAAAAALVLAVASAGRAAASAAAAAARYAFCVSASFFCHTQTSDIVRALLRSHAEQNASRPHLGGGRRL